MGSEKEREEERNEIEKRNHMREFFKFIILNEICMLIKGKKEL